MPWWRMLFKTAFRALAHFEEKWFRALHPSSYWLTRALFLRFLGFIYFLAFFSLSQ